MKIIHFIDGLNGGGKERQLVELLKGLSNRTDILLKLVVMSENICYPQIHQLNVPIDFLIRKSKQDLGIFFKLYKLCKNFQPDIIHTWNAMTSFYAAPIAKILSIKFVNGMIRDATSFGLWDKTSLCSKFSFFLSDAVVANSYAGLKAYYAPFAKSTCIYNGFDFERVSNLPDKNSVKKSFNITTPYVIGMVGGFTKRKDYKTYLSAAEAVLSKRDDVTFLGIGDGETLQACQALVSQGSKGRIIFTGRQQAVEALINIFSIGSLATDPLYHSEGIPNAIMECMALGKPVIATDAGGTGELLIDGETGFLIPPHDPESLSQRIIQLLDDPALALRMGNEGEKRLHDVFNLEKMTNSYITLYKKILQNLQVQERCCPAETPHS